MPSSVPSKSDPIIIVGAGIFGLSTALHLARRGYQDVTVFDKQPYEKTLYSYLNGCDGASADINKIIRSAYGAQTEYQDLSTEALSHWEQWNAEIRKGKDLPPGIRPEDEVFINCGNLSASDALELPAFERATVDNMEAAGHHGTQLITNDPTHLDVAAAKGIKRSQVQPFSRKTLGVLDTTGGLAVADKACQYALHKAKKLGVKFVLAPSHGEFVSFHTASSSSMIDGITTADGKLHRATLTIMACGGWTPSLVPALDGLCEATGGSVIILKIPASSPLRQRLHPSNFPSFTFKVRDGAEGGLYGFPVNEDGLFKIGYRGTKYTNPKRQDDGKERSVPVTRWTSGSEKLCKIPEQAHNVFRRFLDEYLPELGEEGVDVWLSRVCWYTDSYDNHFVIDRVPELDGVMCATGGSGHAFKYLPNIGNWVIDVVEGVGLERKVVQAWKWRSLDAAVQPVNSLMEGSQGERALGNVNLVTAEAAKAKL